MPYIARNIYHLGLQSKFHIFTVNITYGKLRTNQYRLILTQNYQLGMAYTDPVPPSTNQYRLILAQNHQVPTSNGLHCPSTTKYQPIPPYTDPEPPTTNQYRPLLTQCHSVSISTA